MSNQANGHESMRGLPFQNLEPLILASASPRRRELLASMGIRLEVKPSNVEESMKANLTPVQLVQCRAQEKARVTASLYRSHWVLAADTIVVLGGEVFGKPRDATRAFEMLRGLSGLDHLVISAFCLKHTERSVEHVAAVTTTVCFKELSQAEISAYIRTGECFDKAGGYGIQGVGAFMVRSIQGSYTNVVGLPLCETLECLMEHGVIEPTRSGPLETVRALH